VHLPLERTGGGVLTTGVFIDGELFRVIVDTGSPYLVVPLDDCERQPPRLSAFGCAARGQFRPSGAPPTSEQYGALPGAVEWLTGDVAFGETGAQPLLTSHMPAFGRAHSKSERLSQSSSRTTAR
jgi:hypothetical protein